MQSLWARATAQAYGCRCTSCLKTTTIHSLSNRASSAASRRKLLIGNGVTAFYSSIFATAMILDTNSKNKRKLEKQKQIEAVKAEIEQSHNEEIKRLEQLATRRQIKHFPALGQRRQFSTATNRLSQNYEKYRRSYPQSSEVNRYSEELETDQFTNDSEFVPTDQNVCNDHGEQNLARRDPSQPEEINDDPMENDMPFEHELELVKGDLSRNDVVRLKAVQRLAGRQLAIRLLLRPALAHLYGSVKIERHSACMLPELSIEQLLGELDNNRQRINQVKHARKAWFGDLATDVTIREQSDLHIERMTLNTDLKNIFRLYESEEITSPELLVRVADNILSSEEPITKGTISTMMRYFRRFQQNDVVNMIMDSLFDNGFILSSTIIIPTLDFFNKTRNLHGFDGFLKKLCGEVESTKVWDPWSIVEVGNLKLPVPRRFHEDRVILSMLVGCSLSFHQLERANGWLSIMRSRGYDDDPVILGSYLRYFTSKNDWANGAPILMRTTQFLTKSFLERDSALERLVLSAAAFCNACEKGGLAEEILSEACKLGLHYDSARNSTDEREVIIDTLRQWAAISKGLDSYIPDDQYHEKYTQFAQSIKKKVQRAVAYNDLDLGVQDSALAIQNIHLEIEREHHLAEIKDLRYQLVMQKKIDYIQDAVHSSEIAINRIALQVEKEIRKLEVNSLRNEMLNIRQLLSLQNEMFETRLKTGRVESKTQQQQQPRTINFHAQKPHTRRQKPTTVTAVETPFPEPIPLKRKSYALSFKNDSFTF